MLRKKLDLLKRPKSLIIIACLVAATGAGFAFVNLRGAEEGNPIKSTTVSVQGDTVKTPEIFTISPSEKELEYDSPTFKAAYEFNAIAPEWKELDATESNRGVFIRTSGDGKQWSDWMEIHAMRAQKDDEPYDGEVFPEAPLILVGKFFQYRVELRQEDGNSPSIRDMSVTYIDSRIPDKKTSGNIRSKLFPKAAAARNTPNIISRAAWGSPDPDGTALRDTDSYWYPTYKPTRQIFIHHTVTSDYQSTVDGPSVVRAVWEYHANTRGWGDIGYNYLVDQAGNTYEGRAHGDNVTGGHVYEYNTGSSGVALLGCFHPADSACQELNSNSNPPSSAMLDSLTTLLAWTTTRFEIDPNAQHTFCKYDGGGCLNLNTITGHRDANSTACPGTLVLEDLQIIRDTTASKKAEGFNYSAKQLDYQTISLGETNELSVTLRYKNTGANTWYNSGANPVRLATANAIDHTSAFQGSGWSSSNRPATLNEPSVAPGETGSFTFNIINPAGYLGYWHEYFGLVEEGRAHFGTFYGTSINTRSFTYSYVTQAAYTDSSKTTTVDLNNMSPGQTAWLTLTVKNSGNMTWSGTGSNAVRLGTDSTKDRKSAFCTSAWYGCSRPSQLQEPSVAPGANGNFEFPIHVPAVGGNHKEYFTPVVEGITWMNTVGIYYPVTVNKSYAWSFVGQAAYTDSSKTTLVDLSKLSPGQTLFFTVTAKNTGKSTWYNSGSYPLRLGTSRPLDRHSAFRTSSWISLGRVSAIKEQSVAPGQKGTFEATFSVPNVPGSHKEYFRPLAEKITWLNDVGLYLPATIRADYSWSFVGQAAYTDSSKTTRIDTRNLTPGQRFYFEVTAKNTGTATWYSSGNYPLRLGTSNPLDRSSILRDTEWISANRATAVTETSVVPGGIGRFGAYYVSPNQPGQYKEYFRPLAEKITWLNDVGLYIPLEVK